MLPIAIAAMIFDITFAQNADALSARPTVFYTSPASGTQVFAGRVTLQGATTSGPVGRVEVSIDGSIASYRLATPHSPGNWSTWSIYYSIPAGIHYVTARVTDSSGKQDWASITLNALPGPDVKITSQNYNTQVVSGSLTIKGKSSSSYGVKKVEVSMDGNAASYRLATPHSPGNWSTWSIKYDIPPGIHWFTARVIDGINHRAWSSISLTASIDGTGARIATGNPTYDVYDSFFVASAQKYSFADPMVLKAIGLQESDYDPSDASSDTPCGTPNGWSAYESHSYGVLQITPACDPASYILLPNGHPNLTTTSSSPSWPTSMFNALYNIDFGTKEMKKRITIHAEPILWMHTDTVSKMALAGYNAGDWSVYGCDSWNSKAERYVNNVLDKYQKLAQMATTPYPF